MFYVCSSKLVSSKVDRAGILCYSSDQYTRGNSSSRRKFGKVKRSSRMDWGEFFNNCIDLTLEKVENKIERKYGDDIGHKVRLLFIISPEFSLIPNLDKTKYIFFEI